MVCEQTPLLAKAEDVVRRIFRLCDPIQFANFLYVIPLGFLGRCDPRPLTKLLNSDLLAFGRQVFHQGCIADMKIAERGLGHAPMRLSCAEAAAHPTSFVMGASKEIHFFIVPHLRTTIREEVENFRRGWVGPDLK